MKTYRAFWLTIVRGTVRSRSPEAALRSARRRFGALNVSHVEEV